MSAFGTCEGCGTETVLLPLHGGKGGPLRCPLCVGQWNAKHGRRRRTGRVVIRAMMAFLEAGGSPSDIDKLKRSAVYGGSGTISILSHLAAGAGVITDPLGYMDGIACLDGADADITSEILTEVLQLTHPDHHPPEREELARTVTQKLLALQPFVFPAPKPEAPPPLSSEPSYKPAAPVKEPRKDTAPRYPCADCADALPSEYCDACRAEYDKRGHEKDEKRRAKRRAQYAGRGKMWTPPRDKSAVKPRTARQSVVPVNQIPAANDVPAWVRRGTVQERIARELYYYGITESKQKLAAQAVAMREAGKTYREIGEALDVRLGGARHLVWVGKRFGAYKHWSAALSMRVRRLLDSFDLYPLPEADAASAVASLGRSQLSSEPNIGPVAICEIEEWLAKHGLQLQ